MANIDSPFGAVAIGTSDGSDYHGKLREVEFLASDATAAFVGDWVALTGTTGADGYTPVVTQAAAGGPLIGSLAALVPTFEDEGSLTLNYRAASTARKGYVPFGTDVLYTSQSSTVLTAADAGQNADIVVGAGNTITGISGMEIGAAVAAGATAQLRLRRVDNAIGNALGADANWIVNINENQDDHGVGV